ncbi:argD: transaminase, acetylornithine/succinylornithine family [Rubrobacter radiotolerans]|uniref:Acetylornithine aminotransferase n=1 Tax=Rubrobacter radiotolerans TaxID=42256 RepID=A0A023X5K2_RUBRA|nr:aspartate aminotransferase family protein [Rubrobacter radiotolerans]AHY47583.1 argD: transaminase, acetylornithine/succinylornithine family [Rubrobacter radiotolerans]MDX5894988.1 aspartate aminotransferase family protein [Rubrobacter radiotolerans]SMC07215.1 acetylornithine aminotransferase apoenzyme [Rubrobacter radiotolerans DSM 5868]
MTFKNEGTDMKQVDMKNVMETYKRLPVRPVEGKGSWLVEADGTRYLDFIAGIATNSLGHAHPKLVEAVQEQAAKLMHCSNLYEVPLQAEIATMLSEATGFDKVFFCNSGAESVEAAIKLARKRAYLKSGESKHEILTFSKSFHGRTYGGLTATAQPALREGFGPMPEGFVYAEFGNLQGAQEKVGPQTAAILVEPVQGEGGINVAPEGFLEGLRELADRHDALLIFDEVQTGMGRTGHLFAFQKLGVTPDVLTSAKGLGGGFPVGAMLVNEPNAALTPGTHGSTFGGNPLAMAAVKAVLSVVNTPEFLGEVRFKAKVLKSALEDLAQRVPGAEVRGEGLLLGLDLGADLAPEFFERCLKAKLLVNLVGGRTIRLAPPLTVTRTEVRHALTTFRGCAQAVAVKVASDEYAAVAAVA